MVLRLGRWRFAPALAPTLATLGLIALTGWLGHWQSGRADEKRALQARYDHADRDQPIHATPDLDPAAALYRRVEARGAWDEGATILLDNRVQDGVAGYHVLTPLRLDATHALLVNRGWVAVGPDRGVLPAIPTPDGEVAVVGIALPPGSRYFEFASAAPLGRLWQNLDFDAYARQTGLVLAPLLIQQTSAADDGLTRRWPRPDAGVDMHVGYAFQWYSLATTLVVLWIGLNLKRVPPAPEQEHP